MPPLLRNFKISFTLDETECATFQELIELQYGPPVTAGMVERHIKNEMESQVRDLLSWVKQAAKRRRLEARGKLANSDRK